jgi:cytochrome c biogenesis protein
LQDSDKPSTAGIELKAGSAWVRETIELLSSMRFAISALSVLCIASAIGTIVPQASPDINYVNQFGAFWAEVFGAFDVFRVYNAPWFLVFMALMLVSTTLCLIRNTPKMVREARSWPVHVRDRAFVAFSHRHENPVASESQAVLSVQQATDWLKSRGYGIKSPSSDDASLPVVVAKKGGSNRLGYVAAHLAIVVISLGGLLDSEIPTRAAAWWWDKAPVNLSGLNSADDVPSSAKMPQATPTYRANLLIPEGQTSDLAVINKPGGALLLDLPFELTLKEFRVDYYSTGMPKLFASQVVLKDKIDGTVREATIEVNKPLIHRGVAIYQSSFDDGGSKLKLVAHPLNGPIRQLLPIELAVGQSLPLRSEGQTLALEISGFKAINVENIGDQAPIEDPFKKHVAAVLSPAVNATKSKNLRNVGPSFNYKLRDTAGQAKEFHSYMLPIDLDGAPVFLIGVRDSPDESFRYLRIPADENGSLQEYMRLRVAMANPQVRQRAAEIFAQRSAPDNLAPALASSAQRSLDAVAEGGLQGLADLLEQTVPEAERDRAADVVVRMLTSAFWEVWQLARLTDGLPRLEQNDQTLNFTQRALNAYSDSQLFGAPLLVMLDDFEQVQASVFQVTRSPGKTTVYLGCLLLTIGIFAMLYIPERRVWVWRSVNESGQVESVRLAASTTRHSLDFDREFQELRASIKPH